MTRESEILSQTEARNPGSMSEILGHPDDVLHHPTMSIVDKRALLASWASDARAVAGMPMLRQLDDGSIVTIDAIVDALKALDGQHPDAQYRLRTSWRKPIDRRPLRRLSPWFRRLGRDDDDDPPPCPAFCAIPPKRGNGGATTIPEPALA
ncbi:hypothetical protein ACWGTI_08135 [Mesorhizobium sp. ArgA1]